MSKDSLIEIVAGERKYFDNDKNSYVLIEDNTGIKYLKLERFEDVHTLARKILLANDEIVS